MLGASSRPRPLFNLSLGNQTLLYGASNIKQPRISPISHVEHVFLIYLESAELLAWPYSPEFCKKRNCSDIDKIYDTPEYFTPFFHSLATQDPEAVLLENFRTNVAFTTKANLATECGIMPEVKDGIVTEAAMKMLLPCLPDLLRAYDSRFKSRKFVVSKTTGVLHILLL